jgi:hypothetical protein
MTAMIHLALRLSWLVLAQVQTPATVSPVAPSNPLGATSASPSASKDAVPIGATTPLFFELKTPLAKNLNALRAALKSLSFEFEFHCQTGNRVFVEISEADAHRLLERHAVFRTVAGAGNSLHADDHQASIEPKSFVPKSLRSYVKRIWFNDDPKFWAGDLPESAEIDCAQFGG